MKIAFVPLNLAGSIRADLAEGRIAALGWTILPAMPILGASLNLILLADEDEANDYWNHHNCRACQQAVEKVC